MANYRAFSAGLSFLLLAVLACSGCKVEPPKPPLVETVAVLMFDNESNDINAPDAMQLLTYLALKNSAYRPLEISVINEKLQQNGIMDGGQLAVVDPVKLGKDLGVQALLFGNVESFDYTNIGFYLQRKVALSLKMVDAANGSVLWENQGAGSHRAVFLDKDKAKNAFMAGVAEQTVEKLFNSPLEEEARQATINTLKTLPGFSFRGFAKDEKTGTQFKKGAKDLLKGTIRKR